MVGDRLRSIRKTKSITQKQLAEGTNYSKSYIGDIETGRTHPSLKALMAFIEFLKVDPSEFFDAKCCFERMTLGDSGFCTYTCEHQTNCPISNQIKDKEIKE